VEAQVVEVIDLQKLRTLPAEICAEDTQLHYATDYTNCLFWQQTVSKPHFCTMNSQRLDFGQSVSDRELTLAKTDHSPH
jgi:hypothetical protein